MMRVSGKWAVGAFAFLHTSGAVVEPPIWILGEKGKSCEETCESPDVNRHCIGGYWPTDARMLLNRSISAGGGVSNCKDVEMVPRPDQEVSKAAPWVQNEDGGGRCFYMPSKNANRIRCDQKVADTFRRLCPCGKVAPQYMLADSGMSCTDFCKGRGGVCSSDPGRWPQSWQAVSDMATPLGMSCRPINPGSPQEYKNDDEPVHAPSIAGDKCYYSTSQVLGNCDASKAGHRRFCPCLGASLTPLSEASQTHNLGASHADRTGTAGACRGGGFKIGRGTGGTKRRVPGGTLAHNNEECRERVTQYCPGANGATYNHESKDCWCEMGMTSYEKTTGNNVCWFTDETITQGSGSLISEYATLPTSVAAHLPATAIAGCFLAVAAGAAVVVSIRHRKDLRRSAEVADGNTLQHLQIE